MRQLMLLEKQTVVTMKQIIKKLSICVIGGALLAGCQTMQAYENTYNKDAALEGNILPSDAPVVKGQKHYMAGRYGLAQVQYMKAVETNPQNLDAWLGLAASYDRLKRFDLAQRSYKSAIKIGGRTSTVLNNLGYSYLLQGNVKAARRNLMAARKLDPENPNIQANLALLEKGRKFPKRGT